MRIGHLLELRRMQSEVTHIFGQVLRPIAIEIWAEKAALSRMYRNDIQKSNLPVALKGAR